MLPYGRQFIDDDDINAVAKALKSDFLTTGPEIEAFEQELCHYTGAPFAVASSNGTTALHLASIAMGLKPGDQVIVPTISFVATANAPRFCGAEIIFSDVDPESGLMTPENLEEAISRADSSKLKAVFVVHMGGHPAAVASIRQIADKHGLTVVEDACHALGTSYDGPDGDWHMVGACRHSNFATLSFHPVKTITSGEGGVTFTSNEELANNMRLMRSHGLSRDATTWLNTELAFDQGYSNPWYYEMQDIGYNYRLTDLQAALGRSQLKKMPFFAEQRRKLAKHYRNVLSGQNKAFRFVMVPNTERSVQHLMVCMIDFESIGKTRRQVMSELRDRGVGSQVHYIPIHRQPYYSRKVGELDLKGADAYYARCLSLPLYPGMSLANVETVGEVLKDVVMR
ncbi:UDP-4-amino-4,6-dideoxy-N-acetyl-beta-L-altrosamine transaminase [Labrenzia sp. PO1]|uniref:UDP-4-amino-4, 6-dideoxy-N-acetyl-beta-L-altrosamine transaminase n=1 Tax=Labrenzia sp. PO1 TaxID=2720390 RepID=UPI0014474423|nr:UDP-4-amino-4,6-dideoxy-N-acetyl-beta-L-altrosamine transaminase [Labrenzia sp. PO1]NKI58350.1 UDP-4-amino-4,6-dideoxy-N-acetyl-beta-L-altrosamine transaminase [Labrenzia sp. PO1]